MVTHPPRVLYFGTYREEYARNQIIIEGLRRAGWQVTECHSRLWRSVEDRVQTASGGWLSPAFIWRAVKCYAKLLNNYRRAGEYDVLLVGYPGHFDVFLARWLARLRGKPLAWDVLNSLYLITLERGIHKRSAFSVEMLRRVERAACRLPEMMFLDTQRFVDWFAEVHGADASRFRLVPIGADERIFHPIDEPPSQEEVFRVIYYGSYIPNHGVEYIIEAAHLLESGNSHKISFEMVGDGPQRQVAEKLAKQYGLKHVTFVDWLERSELAQHITRADLVLGAFGNTQQLQLTNNNKIYEGFALRKAVVSARTLALPEVLLHGKHLYLCEPGDAASLADAISTLGSDNDLRQQLAENGYEVFTEQFTMSSIGQRVSVYLMELAIHNAS